MKLPIFIIIIVLGSITITTALAYNVTVPSYPYTIPSTGGNYGISVASSGYVGIGTTNPLVPLHLVSSGATEQRVEGGAGAFYTLKDNSGGTDSKYVRMADGGGNMYFQSANDAYTSAANLVTITHAGNVGIGTISPVAKLDIAGNIHLTGNMTTSASNFCIGSC